MFWEAAAAPCSPPRFPTVGIGFAGVSLAFGLTVLTMAYAVGGISGGHFNPAVSVGLATAGRFSWGSVIPYIVAQTIGAILRRGSALCHRIRQSRLRSPAASPPTAMASIRPAATRMLAALVTEVVMTAFFLIIILGATGKRSTAGFAPIAIGLGLTLIHLISIPVTNTSVNPARSTGQAIFAGGWAIEQLWLFWAAPIAGAIIGAVIYNALLSEND